MSLAVWTYPQDLMDEGSAEALRRMDAIGIDEVRLAVSYHRAEVVTPRSRTRRLLRTADGIHFPPEDERYGEIRPLPAARHVAPAPGFLRQIRTAGLRPTAWVVIANNTRLGEAHPEAAVRNAWGELLPFSLCIGSPAVRHYAAGLVGDVADNMAVDEVVLEAWHHRGLGDSMARQLSVVPRDHPSVRRAAWCFCTACSDRIEGEGIDPAQVVDQVRRGSLDTGLEAEFEHSRQAVVTILVKELVDAAGSVPVRLFVPGDASMAGIDLAEVSTRVGGVSIACYADTVDAVLGTATDAAGRVARGTSFEVALRPRDPFSAEPLGVLVAAVDRAVSPHQVSFYQYGQMTTAALDAIAALPGRAA